MSHKKSSIRKKKKVRASRSTRSEVIHVLRRYLWLRSAERSAAVKRESNTCERCFSKGSKAKGREVIIDVHHRLNEIDWDLILDAIFKTLLVDPALLEVLCKTCHKEHHAAEEAETKAEDPDAWMK